MATTFLPPDSALFWLVAAIGIGIIFIGARFVLTPLPAARDFGVPTAESRQFTWLWAKGTRDIASGLLVIGLLLLKVRADAIAAFL